jgi:hypothetical protein
MDCAALAPEVFICMEESVRTSYCCEDPARHRRSTGGAFGGSAADLGGNAADSSLERPSNHSTPNDASSSAAQLGSSHRLLGVTA